MKKWILGAAIMGLGASAIMGGCMGEGSETPAADQPTGLEGSAPLSDRFGSAPNTVLALTTGSLHAEGAASDPGEISEVHASFDPSAFRDGASFRAKLEVK